MLLTSIITILTICGKINTYKTSNMNNYAMLWLICKMKNTSNGIIPIYYDISKNKEMSEIYNDVLI